MEERNKRRLADAGLLFIAMVWGINFVIIKVTIADMPPMAYLGVRFTLAFFILACFSYRNILKLRGRDLFDALMTGCFLFGGFALQTVGLLFTTPGISGFLTVTYVAMVPVLMATIHKKAPQPYVMLGAVLCLAGVGLLSLTDSLSIGAGDALTVLGALLFALHIVALGRITGRMNPLALTAVQLGVVGVLALGVSLMFEPLPGPLPASCWWAVLYGAVFGSIIAYLVQTTAQRYTLPSHTAILLSMEAAFALVFSLMAGMETLVSRQLLGFPLLLAGVLVVELLPVKQKEKGVEAGA